MSERPVRNGGAFVVGTGRCGSTLMSALLAGHPEIVSLSEVFAAVGPEKLLYRSSMTGPELWRLLSEPNEEATELLRHGPVEEVLYPRNGVVSLESVGPLMLACLPLISRDPGAVMTKIRGTLEPIPESPVPRLVELAFGVLRDELDGVVWVERSGGSLAYVDRIVNLWPTAKIVHLWRHGAHCAHSMSQHPYFRVAVARAIAGEPRLDVASALEARPPLARYGAYWSAVVLRGLKALDSHDPELILSVRYETLIAHPEQELSRIARFLGVTPSDDWVSRSLGKFRRSRSGRELDVTTAAELERLCWPGERALLARSEG